MRRYPLRRSATGLVAASAVLALSACGIAGGGGGSDQPATDGEITGEITFQTWNLKGGYEEYFTDLVAQFEEEHPGATVNWVDQPAEGYQDKLSADAAAGNLPDVVDMGPEAAYTLANAGLLLNVAEADPAAQDGYLPTAWDAMTFDGVDGGTYGYPWYLNTGPSFFDTELFEQCGLDPADLPETYDELFDQAEIMAEECGDRASMIGRLPTIETFGMYGVDLMNDEGTEFTFNGPEGVELVERYQDLYAGAGFTEESLNALQTGELDAFKSGELGWLPGSSYTLDDLRKTAPKVYENVEIGPLIANSAPNMYLESLVVNAQSEHSATAQAFARFVTDPERQLGFAHEASVFPSAADSLDDPYFTKDDGSDSASVRVASAQQVGEAVVWWPPAFSGGADVEYLREQIAQAVLGEKSAQDALDDAVAYSNNRLANQ